jgi:hypothetical protein
LSPFSNPGETILLEKVYQKFDNGHQAKVIYIDPNISATTIISSLKIPSPRAVLILNGGIPEFPDSVETDLSNLLGSVVEFASEERILLITGGTDGGIFGLLGNGFEGLRHIPLCIGISVADMVKWKQNPKSVVNLEPHHSHFVLVQGKEWEDATPVMYRLANEFSKRCQSISLFAGGGKITKQEMQCNVEQGREMILLAGSGRSTDAVLNAMNGYPVDDKIIKEIARLGKIIPFDAGKKPSELVDLIYCVLFRKSGGDI